MKQLLSYLLTIILWIVGLVLACTGVTPWLLIALAVLHFIELITIGLRTGLKYGIGGFHSILMCMLFGYLWWLPIRKQIKEDTLSENDFIDDGLEPWREAF